MGVLQETKLTDRIHAWQGEGYSVWETDAERSQRGDIGSLEGGRRVAVEGIVNFTPNVESFLLTSGSRRWYVVGAYMPPHDAPAVYRIKQALEVAPRRMEVILLGNSNVRLR